MDAGQVLASFSLALGLAFLLGQGAVLPAIFNT